MNIFQELGFVIHPEKSQIVPTQEIKFLGFIINSREMTISLTPQRKRTSRILFKKYYVFINPQLYF